MSNTTAKQEEFSADTERFRQKLLEELEHASPFDSFSILQNVELYDERNAKDILDQVNREFNSGGNKVKNIVVPVFTSILDGVFSELKITAEMKKYGLTATSVVTQCANFRYDGEDENAALFDEVTRNRIIEEETGKEGYNINDRVNEKYGPRAGEYDRQVHGYDKAYRDERIKDASADGIHIQDEYTGETIYTNQQNSKDATGGIGKSAELDHIVPLSKVHEKLSQNCMLTDEDIKRIANGKKNTAVSSRDLNNEKRDMTNSEYVEKHGDKLSKEAQKTMLEKEKEAQRNIDKEANKAVLRNAMTKEGAKRVTEEVEEQAAVALEAGAKLGVGKVIIELIKPLYYELSDVFRNGMCAPVGVENFGDAFRIRMARVIKHVTSHMASTALGNILDLVKTLISTIIRTVIDMFFGVVKNILSVIRQGFPVAVSAIKILADKSKTPAERGDATVKLIGGALISVLGTLLVSKIPDSFGILKPILMYLLNGAGTLLFMMVMDKIDLFSAKENKRHERVHEIFQMRLEKIRERTKALNSTGIRLLCDQRLKFEELIRGANRSIAENNSEELAAYCRAIAKFFRVELEYQNSEEFCAWFDRQKQLNFADA